MKYLVRSRWLAVGMIAMVLATLANTPARAQDAPATGDAGRSSLYLPAVMRDKCLGLRPATVYAVQMYGASGSQSPYYGALKASGASWVRNELSWNTIEPTNTTPDKFKWEGADLVAGAAGESCHVMLLTVLGNPAWAAEFSQGPIHTANLPDFAQFMGALAERYDGDGFRDAPGSPLVDYFELYNEPDVGSANGEERWGNHGDQYAAMLKAVYPAVKAANPRAKVVFGGILYDWFTNQDPSNPANNGPFVREFLTKVLANGGGAYFDIMNYHFYPWFSINWAKDFPLDGPGLVEKTAAIRAILQRYNADKPIIITEMGWHNNQLPPPDVYGDDRLQVRLVQQLYVQSLVAGVFMATWWPLYDIDSYPYDSGLVSNLSVSNPPHRKPALDAYLTMTRHFVDVRFVRKVPTSELRIGSSDGEKAKALLVYEFADKATGLPIYVAWTNQTDADNVWGEESPWRDTAPALDITIKGHEAVVYNAFWQAQESLVNSDPKLKFKVTGDPVYVVVTKE